MNTEPTPTNRTFTPSRLWGYKLAPAVIVISFFIILAIVSVLLLDPSLWWALIILILPAIAITTSVYLTSYAGQKLVVTSDALEHHSRGKVERYAFVDIENIHFSEALYFGTVPGKGIAFTAKGVRGGVQFTNFNWSIEDMKTIVSLVPAQYHGQPTNV